MSCRLGSLTRNLSRFSLRRIAPFHSSSAAKVRLPESTTDEDEVKAGGSSVYGHALKTQTPAKIRWQHRLLNSVSFIGSVDRPVQVYNTKGDSFGAYTLINVRDRKGSNRPFRILVEMWTDMAKMCLEHVKPNDLVYVSGRLVSRTGTNENDKSRYKVIVNELNYVAQHDQRPSYQQPEESRFVASQKSDEPEESQLEASQKSQGTQSDGGKTRVESYSNFLQLWQKLFASPHEWWDDRKNKKNSRWPDFKHKNTGEALWLHPNDPPWVKRQLKLLDKKMAEQFKESYVNRLQLWQVFFASPHEWWDDRKNKKNPRRPDFKHMDTGEALWLHPNDPPWVKRQLELLDKELANQCQGEHVRRHSRVSRWMYDE